MQYFNFLLLPIGFYASAKSGVTAVETLTSDLDDIQKIIGLLTSVLMFLSGWTANNIWIKTLFYMMGVD